MTAASLSVDQLCGIACHAICCLQTFSRTNWKHFLHLRIWAMHASLLLLLLLLWQRKDNSNLTLSQNNTQEVYQLWLLCLLVNFNAFVATTVTVNWNNAASKSRQQVRLFNACANSFFHNLHSLLVRHTHSADLLVKITYVGKTIVHSLSGTTSRPKGLVNVNCQPPYSPFATALRKIYDVFRHYIWLRRTVSISLHK